MKSKILDQSGFSILHILPLIAIVAVVTIVGARIIKQSSAATIVGMSCNVTWKSTSVPVKVVTAAYMTITNKTGRNVSAFYGEMTGTLPGVLNTKSGTGTYPISSGILVGRPLYVQFWNRGNWQMTSELRYIFNSADTWHYVKCTGNTYVKVY